MAKAKKKVAVKKSAVKQKENEFEKRQRVWEANQELITKALFDYVLKQKKWPGYTKIANDTKLSQRTIRRHLQDTDIFGDLKLKLKAMSERSLITIGIKAIQGTSVQWSRLFHEIVDGVDGGNKDEKIVININGKKMSIK